MNSDLKLKLLHAIFKLVCMIMIAIAFIYRVKAIEDENTRVALGLLVIWMALFQNNSD